MTLWEDFLQDNFFTFADEYKEKYWMLKLHKYKCKLIEQFDHSNNFSDYNINSLVFKYSWMIFQQL